MWQYAVNHFLFRWASLMMILLYGSDKLKADSGCMFRAWKSSTVKAFFGLGRKKSGGGGEVSVRTESGEKSERSNNSHLFFARFLPRIFFFLRFFSFIQWRDNEFFRASPFISGWLFSLRSVGRLVLVTFYLSFWKPCRRPAVEYNSGSREEEGQEDGPLLSINDRQ